MTDTATIRAQLAEPTTMAAGVLAAADLRAREVEEWASWLTFGPRPTREHIAAEASPAHALAEVALWRGVVERHPRVESVLAGSYYCPRCYAAPNWPCPDMLAVVAAALAYIGADTEEDGRG